MNINTGHQGGPSALADRPEEAARAPGAPAIAPWGAVSNERQYITPPAGPPGAARSGAPTGLPGLGGPVAPTTRHTPGLRQTNPVLWTILVMLGVLCVGALGIALAALLFGAVLFANLSKVTVGATQTESQAVQLGAATTVDAQLNMRAGDLTVSGGASDLLNASFTYNVPQWQPQLTYNVSDQTGSLRLQQPDAGTLAMGNTRNKWQVGFNNTVPIALKANLGAGNVDMKLAGLNLRRLEVVGGAGNTTVDLTGGQNPSLEARVINSVGNTTVIVPGDASVKITLVTGVGQVTADGLTRYGDTYRTTAYGESTATMNVYVENAAGNILLQAR